MSPRVRAGLQLAYGLLAMALAVGAVALLARWAGGG
jgi:hypothetical protein